METPGTLMQPANTTRHSETSKISQARDTESEMQKKLQGDVEISET